MAKDFAFLFYPGDYLRDTQCLSEKSQVAYDRIMCEHMRNICITQEQLNFFIKRLSEDEKKEVLLLLSKVRGGYQIEWVAESICKRKAYSESRRKNKLGKLKNISESYDLHMENENINENGSVINKGGVGENSTNNAEETILGNMIWFNNICMNTHSDEKKARDALRMYHLWLSENDKYPKKRKSVFDGFEKWLRNEKKFYGTHKQASSGGSEKLGTSAARIKAARDF